MCHPLVCSRLANLVGEGSGTLRVWDLGTLEDLGYSIVESPKGPKVSKCWNRSYPLIQGGMWKYIVNSVVETLQRK
jgi:hypothetical protein